MFISYFRPPPPIEKNINKTVTVEKDDCAVLELRKVSIWESFHALKVNISLGAQEDGKSVTFNRMVKFGGLTSEMKVVSIYRSPFKKWTAQCNFLLKGQCTVYI